MRERDDKELEAEVLQALLALTYGGNPRKTRFDLGDCSIRIMTEEEANAKSPPENN